MCASKLSLHKMIFALLKNIANLKIVWTERLEIFNFSTIEYVFRKV